VLPAELIAIKNVLYARQSAEAMLNAIPMCAEATAATPVVVQSFQ